MEENTSTKEYKYPLQAEDFVKLFLASDENFESISERYGFISRRNSQTVLKNVTITGNIHIRNIVSNNCSPILFDHVKIENIIIARSDLSYLDGKYKTRFNFQGCEIEGIYINSGTSIGELFIENDCKVETIEISQASIAFIEIAYTSIKEFSISTNSVIKDLRSKNAIINKLRIFRSTTENIDLEYCSMLKLTINESNCNNLNLYSTILSDFIKIINNNRLNDVSIKYCITEDFSVIFSVLHSLRIEHFGGSISIEGTKMIDLAISADSRIKKLRLTQHNEFDAFISDSAITQLDFSKTILNKQTTITFSKVDFFDIDFSGFTCLGNLFFKKMHRLKAPIDLMPFKEFIKPFVIILRANKKSQEPIQFEARHGTKIISTWKKQYTQIGMMLSIHPKCYSKIRLLYSSLGKTEFTDCPLGEYRIEFSNSKITECFVSGGSIPTNNVHIIGAKENSIEEHEQKASFYNQFKKIFEAQGDIYHATQFQAKWAEEQRKELKLRKKQEYADAQKPVWWSKIKIFFNTTSNDRFTLWLNKISNLHGESWTRTLGVFFGIVIPVIYFFYLVALGIPLNNCALFWKYFEFVNPAHSMKFIDENIKVERAAILLDFFGRIVVSYGIYQFIAAFRKHTKKQ